MTLDLSSENPEGFLNKGFVEHDARSCISVSIEGFRKIEGQKLEPKKLSREEKLLKRSMFKNVLLICFAFTLLFTSFSSMSNLQSSLHQKMGTVSLGAIYVALVSSCVLLPSFLIRKLKPRLTVALAMILYCPYFASLFYPAYFTFIPTALVMGLAGAPLWAGQCTYFSKIAVKYADIVDETYDVIIVRFFGIFFCFFQLAQISGNLLSSAVLSAGVTNFTRSDEFLTRCGAKFCPYYSLGTESGVQNDGNSSTNGTSSAEHHEGDAVHGPKMYIMASAYLTLGLLAAFIVKFLVDPLTRYKIDCNTTDKSLKQLLLATLNHMKSLNQMLITPLTVWSGVQQGFLFADFTAAFVTCAIGVHMVGYSMLCFGVSNAVFSYAFTPLIKYMSRLWIITAGAVLNASLIFVMFSWHPDPEAFWVFFIIPGLWGMADAVWQTQINSLYGVIFPTSPEAAFSNYRLWESLGFLFAYVMGSYLCMGAKLYANLAFLIVGMAGYYVLEFLEKRSLKR